MYRVSKDTRYAGRARLSRALEVTTVLRGTYAATGSTMMLPSGAVKCAAMTVTRPQPDHRQAAFCAQGGRMCAEYPPPHSGGQCLFGSDWTCSQHRCHQCDRRGSVQGTVISLLLLNVWTKPHKLTVSLQERLRSHQPRSTRGCQIAYVSN